MRRRIWSGAALAALLAAGIGVGAVMAQSGDEDGGALTLLDRVAEKLGIDSPRLEQAIRDARSDEIDQAVADGEITQERADELKERLEDLPPGAPLFGHKRGTAPGGDWAPFDFGSKGRGGGFHFGFGIPGLQFRADEPLAQFLGITPEQLREELRADGATLASVAEAHGKTRDELKEFLVAEWTAFLDQLVKDGHLSQERVDEIRGRMSDKLDALIDREWFGKVLPFIPRFERGEEDEQEAQPQGSSRS
jgi:hypothetical protein